MERSKCVAAHGLGPFWQSLGRNWTLADLFGAPGIRFILGADMRPALNAPRRQPTSSVKILLETLGIPRLNEMQSLSIPRIRAATNLLIVAPTGSGKTEAALLPILDALAAGTEAGIRALYVTPL